jgi:serine protease AprX
MADQDKSGLFHYEERLLSRLIFETFGDQRYTQDSPIMPDVWTRFARAPRAKADLLLTPVAGNSPSKLATVLCERLARFEQREEVEVKLRELDDAIMLSKLANPSATGATSLRAEFNVAYSRTSVVAEVTFDQLVCVIVPMTAWWCNLGHSVQNFRELQRRLRKLAHEGATISQLIAQSALIVNRSSWDFLRFCALVGFIAQAQSAERGINADSAAYPQRKQKLEEMMEMLSNGETQIVKIIEIVEEYGKKTVKVVPYSEPKKAEERFPKVFMVTENRTAELSVAQSRSTIKADAANNLFQIDTSNFAWAIIDGGIDAQHPAFIDRRAVEKCVAREITEKKPKHKYEKQRKDSEKMWRQDIPPNKLSELSRVRETYDFTYLRRMLALKDLPSPVDGGPSQALATYIRQRYQTELNHLRIRTVKAREIDWDMVAPLIRIPHDQNYKKPLTGHGTHVAGILGGDWRANDNPEKIDLTGICPQICLYDLRVYSPKARSNEFTIQYALQFVEHLNQNRGVPLIHGVNLSLSMIHKVMSFACGRTPVCDNCNDLVSTGVVVVVAAGNDGYKTFKTDRGDYSGYHTASITDPGNAEDVITVGATHRSRPHNYGVSYFSSRGPTGDGRRKPDLVAPGEKITAPVLNCGVQRMDGTSMAAPHVSGAAALLMARHRELIGEPRRIKEILCRTATDLGRERHFQGAGLIDILRALQSV